MIGDRVRMDPYVRAMKASVREGSIVIDLGTGIGFFAVLACKLGATRVYAIEPDDSIEVARRVAEANGCADRIEFIQDVSTAVDLPRKADVLISDLRGVLPLFGGHIPSVIDARQRLVAPGGILIPLKDELWGTVVESPAIYRDVVEPWLSCPELVEMSPVRHLTTNTWVKRRLAESDFLSAPQRLCTLDYATIETPDVRAEIAWTCTRDGIGDGLGTWFDATLIPGVGFTTAPGAPQAIYGNAFFPFEHPVELEAGDKLTVDLAANLVGSEYVWRWDTKAVRDNLVLAEFRQSTMKASVFPPEKLRKRRDDYVPSRIENIEVARFILERIDGVSSLGSLARAVAECYPARFPDWQSALAHVTKVIAQCT